MPYYCPGAIVAWRGLYGALARIDTLGVRYHTPGAPPHRHIETVNRGPRPQPVPVTWGYGAGFGFPSVANGLRPPVFFLVFFAAFHGTGAGFDPGRGG